MNRAENKVYFSEEDRDNLVVHRYSDQEFKDLESGYRRKRNKRRWVFLVILAILLILFTVFTVLKYLFYLAIAFMVFLIILYEYIDRVNMKAYCGKYYVEIIVDEILSSDTHIEQTLTPGSDVMMFYPILGRDSSTNYRSKFYIDKEQYDTTGVGKKIRISVKGDKL